MSYVSKYQGQDIDNILTSAEDFLNNIGDTVVTKDYLNQILTTLATKSELNTKTTKNEVYPVGSIYLAINSTSPASLFGGTWEQIKDRFILAAGDSYAIGATGGEATHHLTIEEMPSHRHDLGYRSDLGGSPNGQWYCDPGTVESYATDYQSMMNTGGNQPHNNMPPYLVVNIWKRTA